MELQIAEIRIFAPRNQQSLVQVSQLFYICKHLVTLPYAELDCLDS